MFSFKLPLGYEFINNLPKNQAYTICLGLLFDLIMSNSFDNEELTFEHFKNCKINYNLTHVQIYLNIEE
jgi:hypothetical protein